MKWLPWLLAFIERQTGTTTDLPRYAAEIYLPNALLMVTKARAWCLHRGQIMPMITLIYSKHGNSPAVLREISRLILWEKSLHPMITHLILLSNEQRHVTGWRDEIVSWRLMINHERSHARTLTRSNDWHALVDDYMWYHFRNEWDDCLIALLSQSGAYYEMISKSDNDPDHVAWMATEELIARICAVMHSPKDDEVRSYAANRELNRNPEALLKLVQRIEDHWTTSEQFVGWLDSNFLSDDDD